MQNSDYSVVNSAYSRNLHLEILGILNTYSTVVLFSRDPAKVMHASKTSTIKKHPNSKKSMLTANSLGAIKAKYRV